ncbi:MAG: hypothetical protein K2F69_06855 [Bacteroidaceae bacterium]|nr:hypothetical protein [Bacteroidaceae bacterium]
MSVQKNKATDQLFMDNQKKEAEIEGGRTMKKFFLFVLLITISAQLTLAQQFADIIGKDIVLANGANSVGVVYYDKTNKKGEISLDKKNLYPKNVFGKRIHIISAASNVNERTSKGIGVFKIDFEYAEKVLHLIMPLYLKKNDGYVNNLYRTTSKKGVWYQMLHPTVFFCEDIDQLNTYTGKELFKVYSKTKDKVTFTKCDAFPSIKEIADGLSFSKDYEINNYYLSPYDGIIRKGPSTSPTLKEFLLQYVYTEDQLMNVFLQHIDSTRIDSIRTKFLNKEIYHWGNHLPIKYIVKRIEPTKSFINSRYSYGYYFEYEYKATLENLEYENTSSKIISLNDLIENSQSVDEFEEYQKQQDAIYQERNKQRLATLTKKYGEKYAKSIADGRIKIGMTEEMCREAGGEPEKINTTITKDTFYEQWVYKYKYVYLENGIVTSIQY